MRSSECGVRAECDARSTSHCTRTSHFARTSHVALNFARRTSHFARSHGLRTRTPHFALEEIPIMRHRLAHRKLGRVTGHRMALLRNQAEALLRHERIVTTVPKAKELRPFVERLITVAKRGVKAAEPKGRTLAAKRLVKRDLVNDEMSRQAVRRARAALHGAAGRLHPHPAPRPSARRRRRHRPDRAGRQRVRSEEGGSREGRAGAAAAEAPKQKSVGERLRAAAQSLRGKKDAKAPKDDASRAKVGKPAQGRCQEDHHAAQGRRVVAHRPGVSSS